MIKKGFTLAEVIITLSIVGVIAALTVPTFTVNTKNQTYAATLSASVNTLETAFANALIQENVGTLEESSLANMEVSSLSKYLKNLRDLTTELQAVQDSSGDETIYPKNIKMLGSKLQYTVAKNNPIIFSLKNGAIVFATLYNDTDSVNVLSNGGPDTSRFARINIDVNGSDMPNLVGRDVFEFELGQNGILYPEGSKAAALLSSKGTKSYTYADATAAGKKACVRITTSIDGTGCTARLVENGYKVDY